MTNAVDTKNVLKHSMAGFHFFTGTDFAYHALTFGFFVDNLIMKADPKHRQIDQIFREEIAQPYGK